MRKHQINLTQDQLELLEEALTEAHLSYLRQSEAWFASPQHKRQALINSVAVVELKCAALGPLNAIAYRNSDARIQDLDGNE